MKCILYIQQSIRFHVKNVTFTRININLDIEKVISENKK